MHGRSPALPPRDTRALRSRAELLKCVSALMCVYKSDLRRRSPDRDMTLGDILRKATEPSYISYLFNGWKWRAANDIAQGTMAPGTTGNEGAHFDLKAWGRNVRSMTKARVTTLLRLWVLHQLGLHFSENHFMMTGESRRADNLAAMLLMCTHAGVSLGSNTSFAQQAGLGRDDMRLPRLRHASGAAGAQCRQQAALARPRANTLRSQRKKPAGSAYAIRKQHLKEKLTMHRRIGNPMATVSPHPPPESIVGIPFPPRPGTRASAGHILSAPTLAITHWAAPATRPRGGAPKSRPVRPHPAERRAIGRCTRVVKRPASCLIIGRVFDAA